MRLSRKTLKTGIAAAAIFAAVVLVAVLYYRHDPASPVAPKCLFRLITGYDCPGCGSQRALHALLHGDIAAAWGFNPYVFFAAPAAAGFIVLEALRGKYPRLHSRVVNPASISIILAITIAWWIGRNL